MSDDMFGGPMSATGIKWEELEGALLLVKPNSYEEDINTAYGKANAVSADVTVLDGAKKGEEYRETLIFPKVLAGQVKGYIGTSKFALGRLGRGQAKPGQSAPWLLADPTDSDKDTARAWISANAGPGF